MADEQAQTATTSAKFANHKESTTRAITEITREIWANTNARIIAFSGKRIQSDLRKKDRKIK